MHHENEKMALFEALYREYLVPLKKYAYRIGVGYDDIEGTMTLRIWCMKLSLNITSAIR